MIRFNASIRLGLPLTLPAAAISPTRVSNMPLHRFLESYPDCRDIVLKMVSELPEKRFISVSMKKQSFNADEVATTCVDPGWHLDGRMNAEDVDHYGLVCFGCDGVRTLFHDQVFTGPLINELPKTPKARQVLFSSLLDHDLDDESVGFEVPNGTPVYYTTFDFHKGRVVQSSAERLFIRVLSSNHIRPSR